MGGVICISEVIDISLRLWILASLERFVFFFVVVVFFFNVFKPGVENGNPLQYYCLKNPMDKELSRLQSIGS